MTDPVLDKLAENEAKFVDISGVHKLFGSGRTRFYALPAWTCASGKASS